MCITWNIQSSNYCAGEIFHLSFFRHLPNFQCLFLLHTTSQLQNLRDVPHEKEKKNANISFPYLNDSTSFSYTAILPKRHLRNFPNRPMCGSNINCPGDVSEVMQHCRYTGNRDVLRLLRLCSSSEMWAACTGCPVETRSAYMIGQIERDIQRWRQTALRRRPYL